MTFEDFLDLRVLRRKLTSGSQPVFLAYSTARSANFAFQFLALETLAALLPASRKRQRPKITPAFVLEAEKLHFALLKQDSENIARGIYPAQVLFPESLLDHMKRIPRLMWDGLSIYARRDRGRTTEFDETAREFLEDVPRYYQRNFHFQTNGYLSARSAELYEHQVELLFQGSADAMRRLIIPPLKEHFSGSDGHGLKFLEIGAGTGRATRFVHQAFPRARITAVDLSEFYLKDAQRKLSKLPRIDFVQADGASLPFKDQGFDAVYSVFLFHELPLKAREAIFQEAKRVLKPGGFFGFVDSIQSGDSPLFDPVLSQFPIDFHEPFYRNYLESPMEELFSKSGMKKAQSALGYVSKVGWATK